LLSGGLAALQQVTIVLALPFIVTMLLLLAALYKEVRQEQLPPTFTPPATESASDTLPSVAGSTSTT
ncbi:MAG TPA: BCCT family transporter, partial [Actinomycetota bacterium]|nr:BCCT family transporter [Actinomycetota bacterium]